MTEEEIKQKYDQDVTVLRESIRKLENKSDKTADESKLLESLLEYRQKHYSYPSLAYYDFFEMMYLFNYKTLKNN